MDRQTAWRESIGGASRAHHLPAWWPSALAILLSSAAPAAALDRYEFVETKMGAQFKLVFYAADKSTANQAAAAAFEHVDRLNRIFSDYDTDSELSRLSRGSPSAQQVKLSDPLWDVLERSQRLAAASEGAFDVTVGPYVRLWRRARRTGELPAAARLDEAAAAVGHAHLILDPAAHTARLDRPRMMLDLGGIAMGYTVDAVLRILAEHGVRSALVDASGDIALGDAPPGKQGWVIGIAPLAAGAAPSRFVRLANRAISTSGDAFQHVDVGGKRYSHIVDPRTGLGLTDSIGVTIIADNCYTADSLDTTVSVLGPAKGMALVADTPGAEVLILRVEEGQLRTYESPGFKQFNVEPPAND